MWRLRTAVAMSKWPRQGFCPKAYPAAMVRDERGDVIPRRERPGMLTEGPGLLRVVQVLADLAAAVLAILAKQGLELFEQVRLGREMAEVVVAFLLGVRRWGSRARRSTAARTSALVEGRPGRFRG
jgi:hypothetical protein